MSTPNMTVPTMPSQQRQEIPAEQRYHVQLQSLNDMGFDDNQVNIRALTQTHGNVNRAVDVLFSTPPSTTVVEELSVAADVSTSDVPSSSDGVDGGNNSAENVPKEAGDKKND